MATDTYAIPSCATVDFSDIREVTGYSHLFLSLLQRTAPFCCGTKPHGDSSQIVKAAKQWIKAIESHISKIPPQEVITALREFDLTHRLIYNRPASSEFLNRCYLTVFNERIHGNRQICETDLFEVISAGLRKNDPLYMDKPLKWYSLTLEEWYAGCKKDFRFTDTPITEALYRINHLLQENLAIFTSGQKQFKQTLIANYLPILDNLEEHDTQTLRALLILVRSIRHDYLPATKATEYETDLLKRLATSPLLHPLDRAAFSLDLEYLT